ncbi:MAG: sensor histidine kinase, partial [Pseudobdellovibrionaceae bacterium]
ISDNVRLQSSSLISQKLNKRIDKYYFRQRSVLIATFILWLASMVCSYVFYLFNLKRIRNYILQIQDQNEELERVKKLSLLGELAAGIGHEINNPLTIAQLSLEFINRYVEKCQESMEPQAHEDIKNMIVRIDKMILNIRQIIRSFKSFAYNGDDEKISYISLNEAISDSLLLVQYKAFAHGVHITNKIKDDIKVLGTLHGIEQVFVNLINNAIDAMENINEKKVLIEASLQGEFAMIDVSDKGPGISPNLHEKIFKPLFTTKNLSNGTGLGLGLAKKICTKYGGDLVLVDSNKGAKFRVKLKIT